MAAYVYAFTGGTVSKESPVRVRFTSPLVAPDKVGQAVDKGIFALSPAVEGAAIWENEQTIRFNAKDDLPSRTTFVATVNVEKLYKNVPPDARQFEFDFKTRDLALDVQINGIEPINTADMTKQALTGEVTTSDKCNEKELEKVVQASQSGKGLTLAWSHGDDGLHHTFRCTEVTRTTSESTVRVVWNASNLGITQSDKKEITIPALGDFKVMDARIVQESEQYVRIHFSDPLAPTQELAGLVSYGNQNAQLKYAIDGNVLRVYANIRFTGKEVLNIQAAVKNYANQTMKQPSAWTLEFSDVKPAVRLVGRGTIMPNSDGLNFPFEAINLNYVEVEIFKVFNNNILQFLQTNDLGGARYGDELDRVGRVVLQKRIALKDLNANASTQRWTRYAVDLSKLIKADPQAIYQVRIGFKKEYSNYNCNASGRDSTNLQGMTVVKDINVESDDFLSIMDNNWSNPDDEYGGYDNPCSPSYYTSGKFIKRNVIASDLGMIAKRGSDGSVFVVVSDLRTTDPKASVKLDLYDGQNQLITTTNTNTDGTATFSNFKGKPFVIVASLSEMRGYLPLSDPNTLNLSRFDVTGVTSVKGMKGFLYGERGVWRPGDSLYLQFMLEDKTGQLPPNFPVTLELYDPRGTLQYRTTATENIRNIYPFHLATRADAPTGKWRADIKAGGATFSEAIKIETVKPNRLKLNLAFPKKEILAGEENLNANLNVMWLHGAPAQSMKAKIEASLSSVKTVFERYKDYEFDSPVKRYKSEPQVVFDGTTDATGNAKITGAIAKATGSAPGKMKANFKIRAFEQGGDFSSDFETLDYSPYATYTGVFVPKDKQNEKRATIGKETTMKIVVVDAKGNPMANRTVEAAVYRVEWRWWWERDNDDNADFSTASAMKPLKKESLRTDAKGEATISVKADAWGRYLVYVADPISNHSTGDYFYAGYPWDGDEEGNEQSRNNAAMLSFSTNKTKYNVGETVELNIPTSENGKALISLETGAKVVSSKWISVKAGVTKYTFTATADMSPNVYAFVTLVQPHNQTKNDLPIRMYGVAPVTVEDPKTKLQPVVKMPDVIKPEEKVTIEVAEKTGRPMAYTIDLVDDGLLDLTRFRTPSPWEHFYAREALGVQTWDVYDQVLGSYSGTLDRILNIGGDKANKPKNAQRANRFKPVVMHLGPFLSNGGTTRHTIQVPNYIGSVRAMVVASDGKGAYGNVDKTVPVRKPLMLLATLPRVLAPGEKLKLPVELFAMEAKVKSCNVTVQESSNLVNIVGSKSIAVNFKTSPGSEFVSFDLEVGQTTGIAKFKVIAEGSGEKAYDDIEIEIRNPNPMQTNILQNVIAANGIYNTPYTALGTNGTNKATLEVSTIPPIDLASRLAYLLQYPHGCVEQTTSGAMPQLFVDKLLNLSGDQKATATSNVKAALDGLKKFQTSGGGFGYWAGDQEADSWATSYVGHFLLEAKNLGYALPPSMLESWTAAQKKAAQKWVAPDPKGVNEGWSVTSAELSQAYRLYTLSLAKSSDIAAMNALRERKALSNEARWRLAAAYALAGKSEVAKQLVIGASTTVAKYRELSYTFGSELRDQAMILETLSLIGDKAKGIIVAQEVARQLSSGDWYGTQSVAYGLLAMAKFVGDNKIGDGFAFQYTINGKVGTMNSKSPITQIELPANGANNLTVKSLSKQQLFVRVIQKGQPATGETTNAASNLQMEVQYKNMKGEPLNIALIKQGTDFVAEVSVTNVGALGRNYREMALSQVFPSGWEINNVRMDNLQTFSNTSIADYQNFRDDRVYTYFDLPRGRTQTYRVKLNAAYIGKFYLPTTLCEAMYDNSISARQAGQWVEVVRTDAKTTM